MQKYQDVASIIGPPGLIPVVGVQVYVYNHGTSTQATIFSDNSSTVTGNPLTTDSSGRYSFYAADGRYDLTVSGAGIQTTTLTDIVLQDSEAGGEIQFLTPGTPLATFNMRSAYLGQDTFQIGYNLSPTLYTPNVTSEPQLWIGLETNFPNNPARDPGFGTDPTAEMYFRYSPIGSTTNVAYLETLFFNVDRTANKIVRGDLRAEHVTIANTNDGSNRAYIECNSSATAITNPTTINGAGSGLVLTLLDTDCIALIQSSTGTNRARLRFKNTGGIVEMGLDNNSGNGIFTGGGGIANSAFICNQTNTPIAIGHSTPELTIANGGAISLLKGISSSALPLNASTMSFYNKPATTQPGSTGTSFASLSLSSGALASTLAIALNQLGLINCTSVAP